MLSGFIATMKALTAVCGRSCEWVCLGMFAPFDPEADRRRQGFEIQGPQLKLSIHSRPGHTQRSLLISFDLLTIPPPTSLLPFPHDRFGTLRHRRELPRLPLMETQGAEEIIRHAVKGSLIASRLPDRLGRSEFIVLRTGHSTQVALHPASRQRSYLCYFRLVTFAW
jgi:hypothetical protein